MPARALILIVSSLLALAAAGAGAGAGAAAGATGTRSIQGIGSTMLAPLEAEWATAFQQKTGITVGYEPVDSNTGIDDVARHQVDFAASEAPLTSDQTATCGSCVELPWALSALGVGYHVAGLHGSLRLSGTVLADIYLGRIRNWNAPQIRALNPGVKLPKVKIVPVFRNDGAGATYVFSTYLGRISRSFARQVGIGTQVSFPVGTGAQGDFGVTGLLESVNGTIGYAAAPYLAAHKIPAAAVENAAGKFVYPNLSNIEAAGHTAGAPAANGTAGIVDPPASAPAAYPVATFSYAVAWRSSPKLATVKQFIQWALGPGASYGANLDFAPLPKAVLTAARSEAATL